MRRRQTWGEKVIEGIEVVGCVAVIYIPAVWYGCTLLAKLLW